MPNRGRARNRTSFAWLCLATYLAAGLSSFAGLALVARFVAGDHGVGVGLADGHLDLVLLHHPSGDSSSDGDHLHGESSMPHADHVLHLCRAQSQVAAPRGFVADAPGLLGIPVPVVAVVPSIMAPPEIPLRTPSPTQLRRSTVLLV